LKPANQPIVEVFFGLSHRGVLPRQCIRPGKPDPLFGGERTASSGR